MISRSFAASTASTPAAIGPKITAEAHKKKSANLKQKRPPQSAAFWFAGFPQPSPPFTHPASASACPQMRLLAAGVEGPPQPDDSAPSVVGPSSRDPGYYHLLQLNSSARIRPTRAGHNFTTGQNYYWKFLIFGPSLFPETLDRHPDETGDGAGLERNRPPMLMKSVHRNRIQHCDVNRRGRKREK
jgi:hypothetical protein